MGGEIAGQAAADLAEKSEVSLDAGEQPSDGAVSMQEERGLPNASGHGWDGGGFWWLGRFLVG